MSYINNPDPFKPAAPRCPFVFTNSAQCAIWLCAGSTRGPKSEDDHEHLMPDQADDGTYF